MVILMMKIQPHHKKILYHNQVYLLLKSILGNQFLWDNLFFVCIQQQLKQLYLHYHQGTNILFIILKKYFHYFRRHVLKFSVTCPLASHLQIMSDTHDFTFGDEDQLLSKIVSVPVNFPILSLCQLSSFVFIGRC